MRPSCLGIPMSLRHLKKLEEPNPRTRKSEYSWKTETSAHAIYLAGTNQE